jgi:hypothetical protein
LVESRDENVVFAQRFYFERSCIAQLYLFGISEYDGCASWKFSSSLFGDKLRNEGDFEGADFVEVISPRK